MEGKLEAVRGQYLTSCPGCHGIDRVIEAMLLPEPCIASKAYMDWRARDAPQLPVELDREPSGPLLGQSYLRQAVHHAADHTRPPEANPELKGEVAIGEDPFHPFKGNLRCFESSVNGGVLRPVVT